MSHMLAQPQQPPQAPLQSQSRPQSQATGTVLRYPDYPSPSMASTGSTNSSTMKVSPPPTLQLNVSLPPISLPPPQEPATSLPSFFDLSPTELPPIQQPHEKPAAGAGQSLPSLSSLTGSQVPRLPPITAPSEPVFSPLSTTSTATTATSSVGSVTPAAPRTHWPSTNPFSAYYTPSYVQSPEPPSMRMESPHGTSHQRATSVSLDDPGVRAAAEALGRLRTVDTMPHDHDAARNRTPERFQAGTPSYNKHNTNSQQNEPLLQLITTSYPSIAPFAPYLESASWACSTAYTHSKNYSPAAIKGGAEYIEDRVVKPVAKTVGRYGSHGLRWWLQKKPGRKQRQAPDSEDGRPGSKRRKAEQDDRDSAIAARVLADFDLTKDRRASVSTVDTLPAYDDQRSPAYTETDATDGQTTRHGAPPGAKYWVSTSSLRVAMQDESKRKIRALIKVLKNANGSLTNGLGDLTKAVEEYDRTLVPGGEDVNMEGHEKHDGHGGSNNDENKNRDKDNALLSSRISKLATSVRDTTLLSVAVVNKTAANALPDNVKDFITRHIMSLPKLTEEMCQRESPNVPCNSNGESTAVRRQAHSALALATVSLNVLSQISEALTATLEVAEGWCETQGRQQNSQPSSPLATYEPVGADGDINMSD
ncbi:transcription factor Opi1-domain-containing protein [Podospora australis]|uniref:Transcription factor Opi1-domain-containing protein n=1 Tax=Podospora australis TaxID=1536484 RepID=A0AAN6WT99_9PEZI|nr:transcription factor Opi1-domain-containing protein [Podospora australis]